MIDVLDGVLGDAQRLMTAAVSVVAIWFVIWTWVRTRSLVPTLGALLLGAIVIFGVQEFDFLKQQVDQDVRDYAN
jgi:hypothetical protein